MKTAKKMHKRITVCAVGLLFAHQYEQRFMFCNLRYCNLLCGHDYEINTIVHFAELLAKFIDNYEVIKRSPFR